MKNTKNNKGFSLVELIVVVLIMAIIAVALAPQVMKWVANARVSADVQSCDAIIAGVQLAVATGDAAGDFTISATKGEAWTVTATSPNKCDLSNVLGANWANDGKPKSKDITLNFVGGAINRSTSTIPQATFSN